MGVGRQVYRVGLNKTLGRLKQNKNSKKTLGHEKPTKIEKDIRSRKTFFIAKTVYKSVKKF